MQLADERELKKYYTENPLPTAVLLFGDDNLAIQNQLKKLTDLAGNSYPEFNSYSVCGRTAIDGDELLIAARALPFFAEKKSVVIDDLDAGAQDSDTFDKILAAVEDKNPSTLLVITVRTVEFSLKKGSRDEKLFKACDKCGLTVKFTKPSEQALARAASTKSAKAGVKMGSDAAALLARYCGGDSLRTQNETEKLIAYSGGEEITAETVRLLVAPVIEAKIFELSESLISNDGDKAFKIVGDLLELRERPEQILAVLSMSFADMAKAKAALSAGVTVNAAARELGYNEYRFKKAAEKSGHLSAKSLYKAVDLILAADSDMKTTGANSVIILQTLLTNLRLILN